MLSGRLFQIASEEESSFQGIPVMIEHPKGSTRRGRNAKGERWARKMRADYGYVPDTRSSGDKEDLDVYIGPDKDSPTAYVIEQLKEDGSFDEVKVMLGFDTKNAATVCYLMHYPDGWASRVGDVWELPVARLAEMVDAEQTANEQQVMEEADRHRKAAVLCVTDPVTKKRTTLRDAIELGFDDAPEVSGPGRFLTVSELREAGRRYMEQPRFKTLIQAIAPGRQWTDLNDREQMAVLRADQRLSQGG